MRQDSDSIKDIVMKQNFLPMEWGHASKVTLLFRKDKGEDKRDGRLKWTEDNRVTEG